MLFFPLISEFLTVILKLITGFLKLMFIPFEKNKNSPKKNNNTKVFN